MPPRKGERRLIFEFKEALLPKGGSVIELSTKKEIEEC